MSLKGSKAAVKRKRPKRRSADVKADTTAPDQKRGDQKNSKSQYGFITGHQQDNQVLRAARHAVDVGKGNPIPSSLIYVIHASFVTSAGTSPT